MRGLAWPAKFQVFDCSHMTGGVAALDIVMQVFSPNDPVFKPNPNVALIHVDQPAGPLAGRVLPCVGKGWFLLVRMHLSWNLNSG